MELLTTKEVAEILKVKPNLIYRLKAEGKLHGVHVGGALRFKKSDVETFIAELSD